ncbi:MAG: ABC transporter ATP-binding protein, partial [Solobacterium sp.]|nr:ABC transporter ATP-binding protein [Solobacterium sp.]
TLDPKNRRMIINTINSLKQTKIITSHDLDMILDTCSRVILLSDGKIVKDAATEEILKDRELLEANRMELPLSFSRMNEGL